MTQTSYIPLNGLSSCFNPAEGLSADDLTTLLRSVCNVGLTAEEQEEMDDQLEALVPALVELRDAGHITLNMRVIADSAKLEGFMRLAEDDRLSSLSQQRCRAIRDRILTQSIKALLWHLQLTRTENDMDITGQMEHFDIEEVGSGFMVADYSGGRGLHGAAYAGCDGIWHDQPMSVREPFVSEESAREWAQKQSYV